MPGNSIQKLQVAVLLGGNSPERAVSLMSGETVATALTEAGALVTRIDTAQPSWWSLLGDTQLAFICLHGAGGEDGVVQGLLETLGVPYTGCGVLASALAMDKVLTKRVWQSFNLPSAAFVELTEDSDFEAVIEQLGSSFVKPIAGGSSIGTGRADTAQELESAWREAASFDSGVIAERLIAGPEYTVAILGDRALPAIRMETDNAFYDYEAKYLSDQTRYLCPCGLPEPQERELAELAVRAFRSLGCEVWGRVDFMREPDGRFMLLEVNTVPGMTGHSQVPMAARSVGIELPELVSQIALASLERFR
jgi:D-alanine-D-alanine ligase